MRKLGSSREDRGRFEYRGSSLRSNEIFILFNSRTINLFPFDILKHLGEDVLAFAGLRNIIKNVSAIFAYLYLCWSFIFLVYSFRFLWIGFLTVLYRFLGLAYR